MTNIEAYKAWAPDNALWTDWAKPVLFAGMTDNTKRERQELVLPYVKWLNFLLRDTAIILDMPGEKGVLEALALAKCGYRPVPLYNGVQGKGMYSMIVDVTEITNALYQGANMLCETHIPDDAPPVFMLDSRRMSSYNKLPGYYDNRWCVFAQDMPSASFLKKHKINRVIVHSEKDLSYIVIKSDLLHILRRYRDNGIVIQHTFGEEEAKDIAVEKPPLLYNLSYRFRVMAGLSRNPAGGFGSLIPEQESQDGGRYYGIG